MANVRDYAAVTAAYWAFTLTDGALRMLVLLHFHRLGFSPVELAFLFLLYEGMGILTNFFGGWIGARFGLRLTLFAGLAVQIGALLMLSAMNPAWTMALSVAYVMTAQALSGVAKDLTKMSSKSAVKLVVKEDAAGGGGQGLLFRWVALLTGSKNALKGLGFFLGGLLLEVLGFAPALWVMAGMLALVLAASLLRLKADMGKAKSPIKGRDLFSKTREINLLSIARIFLFASRDVWFVVGVPIFLYSTLGWDFDAVGAFMAAWVIGYGMVQASVPKLLRRTTDAATGARAARVWAGVLALIPAAIAAAMTPGALGLTGGDSAAVLIGGLLVFGAVFAVNSSVHSYLIVAYSDADKVAMNVGFYYMANAVGRLGGTLASGVIYQLAGLTATLWASAAMLAVSFLVTLALPTLAAEPERAG
ncbi:organoarsenical effux MFS transporter ArsJ [Caenispirillum salinarum]|uniref:organoarsenical effux MFS transporter ArsJ n=1 Tax=Caenispirillum salinarum TaxID=859058 RepID=UPI00384F3D8D